MATVTKKIKNLLDNKAPATLISGRVTWLEKLSRGGKMLLLEREGGGKRLSLQGVVHVAHSQLREYTHTHFSHAHACCFNAGPGGYE